LPFEIQNVARRKLQYLQAAENLQDLFAPPGNRLELLKGKWKGFYSVRINDQWRICFQWTKNAARDVAIKDYH
jgi:proteic killer suppression protein